MASSIPIEYKYFSTDSFDQYIRLTVNSAPGQSRPGSDGNEELLYSYIVRIGALQSDAVRCNT